MGTPRKHYPGDRPSGSDTGRKRGDLLSNLQHLEFLSIDGEYLTVLFNSNFYCIYGNDHEVSCSGFLFNGSSHVVRFMLNESERRSMEDVVGLLDREFTVSDNLQEEMLRILLKRFIIQSTRIARKD